MRRYHIIEKKWRKSLWCCDHRLQGRVLLCWWEEGEWEFETYFKKTHFFDFWFDWFYIILKLLFKNLILVERISKFKGKAKYLLRKLIGYLFIERCQRYSKSFKGSLKLHNDPKVEILDETNLIYRGSILRYSDWL